MVNMENTPVIDLMTVSNVVADDEVEKAAKINHMAEQINKTLCEPVCKSCVAYQLTTFNLNCNWRCWH